jgi:hypothetical protein
LSKNYKEVADSKRGNEKGLLAEAFFEKLND